MAIGATNTQLGSAGNATVAAMGFDFIAAP
jgi:hypothetical protein